MEAVFERIKPDKKDLEELEEVVKKLLSEVKREADKKDRRLRVMLLGSASRGTWLRDEKDLDVFVSFPLKYSKEELEDVITRIGGRVLEKPGKRYAEHPYVMGRYNGYEVEIVPCYAVESPSQLRSAVDRTPFHDVYVREHIQGKEDEVRLLKQFLKGISCYGAEARVEGFSGYLCELLVIKYGSFRGVLEAARGWTHGEVITLAPESRKPRLRSRFPSSLVFIDPVDRGRNVASALSKEKFGIFCHAAREYLARPRIEFFFPRERRPRKGELLRVFEARGTGLVAVFFEKPGVLEDVLYTQGRKALRALEKVLIRGGFGVVSSAFFAGERVCLLYELACLRIPRAVLHLGPRTSTPHEKRFLEKYRAHKGKLTEAFILGGRWAVYLRRRHTRAEAYLEEFISGGNLEERGVPSYVARSLEKGAKLKTDREVFEKEFLGELQGFLDPRFPWEN